MVSWSPGVLACSGSRCQDGSGKGQEARDSGVVGSLARCPPRGTAAGAIRRGLSAPQRACWPGAQQDLVFCECSLSS